MHSFAKKYAKKLLRNEDGEVAIKSRLCYFWPARTKGGRHSQNAIRVQTRHAPTKRKSLMKIKTVVSAIMAISLLSVGGAAFADDHDHHDDRGHDNYHNDARDDHRDNHRDDRGDRGDRGDHRDERGAGPEHAFHRGDRLPGEYRDRQYVVEDWRDHHLSAPPRGYHWVQTGGDYVLVSIGNGIILN